MEIIYFSLKFSVLFLKLQDGGSIIGNVGLKKDALVIFDLYQKKPQLFLLERKQ